MKVMIVDDDFGMRLLVKTACEQFGINCVSGERGEDVLPLYEREHPDVVVLDVMMPHVDGFEACRRIRAIDEDVPVLFLSAKGDIVDKKTGFAQGGDDYLVKPFDEDELLMRVQALARRAQRARQREQAAASRTPGEAAGMEGVGGSPRPYAFAVGIPQSLRIGPFFINPVRHEVIRDGSALALAPKEFQILLYLAQHHGDVITKEELIDAVWGEEYLYDAINIAVHIRRIREKIETDPTHPAYLRTVRGAGYVFDV